MTALLWSRTPRALSSLQRLAPVSCSGPTTRTLPFSCRGRTSACGVVQPMGGVALIPPIAQCSLLRRWALPVPGVDAGFYKRMRSSLLTRKREPRGAHPSSFSAATGRPLGKHSPAPSRETGVGVQEALAAEGGPQAPAPSSSVKPTSFSPVLTQCARR